MLCCLGCFQQGEVGAITLLFHLGLRDEAEGSTVDAIAQTALFLGTIVEDVTQMGIALFATHLDALHTVGRVFDVLQKMGINGF